MSIQSEINRLKQVVSNAYTAIGAKGGTVPSSKVSGNLVTAIQSIPDGVELNFEVVGGTSAPSNPKENTIWVNTSTPITSWVFSSDEPANPTPGMVWISTSTSSTAKFNALKENNITVYPLAAKQYVNGAWVDKSAKTRQGGVWGEWTKDPITLYDNGTHYEQFEVSYDNSRNAKEQNGYLIVTPQAGSYGAWTTSKPIDVTGYRKLTAYARRISGGINALWIGLVKDASSTTPDVSIDFKTNTTHDGPCETQLNGLSGLYYVKIYMKFGSGNEGELHVKTIGLE